MAMAAIPAMAQTRVNPNRSADLLNQQVLDALQSRNATPVAAAPAPAPVPAPVGPGMNLTGIYLGVNAGSNFRNGTDYQVGGVMGYQFHRNLAGEITYDYNRTNNATNGQMVMANLVASQRLGQTAITPYVLAGAGMGWNAFGVRDTGSNLALYNVGAGVRLNIVSNVDLDARYRYVGTFNAGEGYNQQVVTGGLNIRF